MKATSFVFGFAVALAACSNAGPPPPQFPTNPPPNPSYEPPNEAVGPEAVGAPYGPVPPESTPAAPDPGPTVVGTPPASPPRAPAITDGTPIDPDRPMPPESMGTNVTLAPEDPTRVLVDGRADIEAASLPMPDPARGGLLPTQVLLAPSGGVIRFRSVTGSTRCGENAPAGPDVPGCGRLIAVFTGETPAKPRQGSEEMRATAIVRPALGHTFVVGDGLTGTGTGDIQTFAIPKGASRLYLGYAGDTYAQNAGGVSAIVTQAAR
jgi:hypothetical protein